jgi:hypothetical protein
VDGSRFDCYYPTSAAGSSALLVAGGPGGPGPGVGLGPGGLGSDQANVLISIE